VKEEIKASGLKNINAGMYTYPVHQAADILFCKGNVVPVGKDQLPHLELTRTIARRFNERFANNNPVFPEPQPLLSSAPVILGLDGGQKMSKSRNNAIMLSATEDETVNLIKRAKTDGERLITYDPIHRPEVSNLLLLASLCSGDTPERIAASIGDQGAGRLKSALSEILNEYLRPLRKERTRLEADNAYITSVLKTGIAHARDIAIDTLQEVRNVMNMEL
jgi:tryptophanyl-tRNA synthetase